MSNGPPHGLEDSPDHIKIPTPPEHDTDIDPRQPSNGVLKLDKARAAFAPTLHMPDESGSEGDTATIPENRQESQSSISQSADPDKRISVPKFTIGEDIDEEAKILEQGLQGTVLPRADANEMLRSSKVGRSQKEGRPMDGKGRSGSNASENEAKVEWKEQKSVNDLPGNDSEGWSESHVYGERTYAFESIHDVHGEVDDDDGNDAINGKDERTDRNRGQGQKEGRLKRLKKTIVHKISRWRGSRTGNKGREVGNEMAVINHLKESDFTEDVYGRVGGADAVWDLDGLDALEGRRDEVANVGETTGNGNAGIGETIDGEANGGLQVSHGAVAMPMLGDGGACLKCRQYLSFVGMGLLVAVGYMDPGNWQTDLEGGVRFRYSLLWVVFISSIVGALFQYLSIKLGVAGEVDLARACRDAFSPRVSTLLWILAEIGIIATDLSCVVGAALALKMVLGVSLISGLFLTIIDVLVVMLLERYTFRLFEIFVGVLSMGILVCMCIELSLVGPGFSSLMAGFVPSLSTFTDSQQLFVATSILGATIMPHNLYLHSSVVQTRNYPRTEPGMRIAIRYSGIDSSVSMALAMIINCSILILAAATMYDPDVKVTTVSLETAPSLISTAIGSSSAAVLFAVALLLSGQASTVVSTLAGQIVMEGFLDLRVRPWVRRLVTRGLALIPGVIVVATFGEAGVEYVLVVSQVILSLQLAFAIVPLIKFTDDEDMMGVFVNSPLTSGIARTSAILVIILNVIMIGQVLITGTML